MKPEQVSSYSLLMLKSRDKNGIHDSWEAILHFTYIFSKDIVTLFPLRRDLIGGVDRLLDSTVESLGTDFQGLRYLPKFDKENRFRLLRESRHLITDDDRILKQARSLKKPCIYFNNQIQPSVFILRDSTSHVKWAKEIGFSKNHLCYYDETVSNKAISDKVGKVTSKKVIAL